MLSLHDYLKDFSEFRAAGAENVNLDFLKKIIRDLKKNF